MAKKADYIEAEGKVIDVGGGKFQVELENGHIVEAHLSGKMRSNYIRILVGDKVDLLVSTYDMTKGRITYRR